MIIRILGATGAAIMVLAAYPAVAQQRQRPSPLPPGVGRDIVAAACTQCHGPGTFTYLREDANAWRSEVYQMVLHGAQILPGQIDTVVNYFASNFGPGINVPPPVRPVSLADGAGKELVQGECALCHGLDRVAALTRSPQGWSDILKRMQFFGAPVSGQDQKTILAYLNAKYGVTLPSITR